MRIPFTPLRSRHWILLTLGMAMLASSMAWLVHRLTAPLNFFTLPAGMATPVPASVPSGLPNIRAEICAACHPAIYQEWKGSIHAEARRDPIYRAFLRRERDWWVCLTCHTPLDSQREFRVQGLKGGNLRNPILVPNPSFDSAFREEGVTCAACHVRKGTIMGPYAAVRAPHPTTQDARFLDGQGACVDCHNVASAKLLVFLKGQPCGTFNEVQQGKLGGRCVECHMPVIKRPVAVGGPVRKARQHLWEGGHSVSMLRKAVRAVFTSSRARYGSGEMAEYVLTLSNVGAGHAVPTGDPDRFVTVEFQALDDLGRVLLRQETSFGRRILWRPVVVELADTRLKPGESRSFPFAVRVPSLPERLTVEVRVVYHLLTERAREKWQVPPDTPIAFDFYRRSQRVVVESVASE